MYKGCNAAFTYNVNVDLQSVSGTPKAKGVHKTCREPISSFPDNSTFSGEVCSAILNISNKEPRGKLNRLYSGVYNISK
jgi:hypothetical protein